VDTSDPNTSTPSEVDWPGDERTAHKRGVPHYLVLSGFLGATATMGLLAVVAKPDARGYGTHEQLGLSPCRLKQWTDIPCPGCGVTTSVTLAVQGRPLESFLVQPFGLITAISLPLLSIWAVLGHFRGVDVYRTIETRKGRWVKIAAGLMAVAWAYKLIAG